LCHDEGNSDREAKTDAGDYLVAVEFGSPGADVEGVNEAAANRCECGADEDEGLVPAFFADSAGANECEEAWVGELVKGQRIDGGG